MALSPAEKKHKVAAAALEFLAEGMILGVGTGSTVNALIDQLGPWKGRLRGAVSSSEASSARLRQLGIPLFELNDLPGLDLYIDGADEANGARELIKGGGAALTREKIVAAASRKFVCIVDGSKLVDVLGKFPLPIEVIPMARSYVAREIVRIGGQPELRQGFTTDNGNVILDVRGLKILDPVKLETDLNQLAGVVTVGLFARRGADTILVGGENGVRRIDLRR